ncbi:hypothetical protein JNUCC64_25020 [Streptomyces sp. JNUCC 64]
MTGRGRGTRLADRLTNTSVAAFLATAGIVAGVFVGGSGLGNVVAGCGFNSDAYPSETAEEWAAHADQVVVATPVEERDGERREFTGGIFRYQMDREVKLRNEKTLWSAERPRRSIGTGFELVAPGWKVFRKSGARFKSTTSDAPRLETGHTYLLALRWDAGRWTVLGEGAAIPFDDGTVGRGEWCGRVLAPEDVARGELFSRPDDTSLEEVTHGRGIEDVLRELRRAERE